MTQAFTGLFITNNNISFNGLAWGRIDGKQSSGAEFGNIHATFGYNFAANQHHHIGVGIRISAPTGNTPQAIYVLEPITGAGGSWRAGLEFIAHGIIYQRQNTSVKLWFDAYAMHVFKGRQIRSFDTIANGPGSKYLLVGDFGPYGTTFQGITQQLINVSTLIIDSAYSVTIDSALLFDIQHHNWNISLGYNFWGHSPEQIFIEESFNSQRYGFVGHQHSVSTANPAVSLTDHVVDPTVKMNQLMPLASDNGLQPLPGNMIPGTQSLNISGAQAASTWTSKLFSRVAYQWNETDFIPTIGAYSSVEFSQSGNSAVSQWSVALQGGISF